ncbi:Transcription factor [Niveomyces insectorum RCEF 264]|uniref:Transcription factor n=1 Tax=Niveomyces insectorum RCEF 264 TaxID=1081102 RepID=A0A167YLV3_9HYPO|nr:Transcription factor [Niveomyces insectorum RCEF 264]
MSTTSKNARRASAAKALGGARLGRGLTCANCRARKTRCDGTQPRCKTCDVYGDECRYEKIPPLSRILSMARRLQEAELANAQLRQELKESQSRHTAAAVPVSSGPSGPATSPGSPGPSGPGRPFYDSPPSDTTMHVRTSVERHEHRSPSALSLLSGSSPSKESLPSGDPLSDLSVDKNGKICYVGATSAVRVAPPALEPHAGGTQTPPYSTTESDRSNVRTLLTSKAIESRTWESLALGNAALQTDIPRAVVAKTLQIHWVWIAPMFMWVYRPAFMRDMGKGSGPYYSPLLLTVLCAHASRFCPDATELCDVLLERARRLLGQEIQRPSSIPTVQALLQLSCREMACGSISQAWLYSGMAFRMVSDLGLHYNYGKLLHFGHLTAEDLEIRRRLFWSCYFWDKVISLYLGRMPALVDLPCSPELELLDDFAEHEQWHPHMDEHLSFFKTAKDDYPPMQSHAITAFENACKLAILLNDIIRTLYARRAARDLNGALHDLTERLQAWRDHSPSHLRYSPANLPAHCPPLHIMTQNLLYYAAVILLHRPFYADPAHHAACRQASDDMEPLLLLLGRTFGYTRITYLVAYCIYTGASVIVSDVRSGDAAAARSIQTFLHALTEGRASCPLVERSIDIINSGLQIDDAAVPPAPSAPAPAPPPVAAGQLDRVGGHVAVETDTVAAPGTQQDTIVVATVPSDPNVHDPGNGHAHNHGHHDMADMHMHMQMHRNYLPAFPYRDLPTDGTSELAYADISDDLFSMLNSFPESQYDSTSGEWYMPP